MIHEAFLQYIMHQSGFLSDLLSNVSPPGKSLTTLWMREGTPGGPEPPSMQK